jgi:polysaccharide biosynthesis/export protein
MNAASNNQSNSQSRPARLLPQGLLLPPHTRFARALFAGLVAVLSLTGVQAQERRSTQQQFKTPVTGGGEVATSPNVIVSPNEDYRIGPGDVIEVLVEDAPELNKVGRVTSKGTFLMNYLQHIPVAGKTSEELSASIADGLRGRYLKTPLVTVNVRQINSHSFFIQGAVRRPGVYQIEGRPSLMKLITVAGGLQDSHGSTAFVIRELKAREQAEAGAAAPAEGAAQAQGAPPEELDEDVKYEVLKANVSTLYKGRFDQNVQLEPGDIVNVPPADIFFVAGEVREPGSFPLKDGTTLRQAISMAQGVNFKGAPKRGVIYRETPNGQREEIKVDIAAVMDGKKDDIVLAANDIIIVPNSALKSTALPILSSLSSGISLGLGNRMLIR